MNKSMVNLNARANLAQPPNFASQYLYPTGRFCYQCSVEAIKVVFAAAMIEIMAANALYGTKLAPRRIWQITMEGPFQEEVIFRGIVQSGIGLIQAAINRYIIRRELTPREIELQKLVRIHLTAFIFAAAHLKLSYSSLNLRLKNLVFCYLSGVAYGQLREKYETISLPFLFHGTSNVLGCYFAIAPTLFAQRFCQAALYSNLAFAYALGNSEWISGCFRNSRI
jgi:hypothetical protein